MQKFIIFTSIIGEVFLLFLKQAILIHKNALIHNIYIMKILS